MTKKFTETLRMIQQNSSQKDIVLREEANASVYMSPEMMTNLTRALAPPHCPINVLVFCGYTFPTESLQILASFLRSATELESLDMAFCALTVNDVSILLSDLLAVNRAPLRLNLGYNKLGSNAGDLIARALLQHPGRISQLCVRSNALTTEGVVPLLSNDTGLTSLDAAFTDMKPPYDNLYRMLHDNGNLVHLKLVGAAFTEDERLLLDRVTINNARSRLQERSQVPTLDSRGQWGATSVPRRGPLIDTPQFPTEDAPHKDSSSPVASNAGSVHPHSSTTTGCGHAVSEAPPSPQDITKNVPLPALQASVGSSIPSSGEVTAMREELALLRTENAQRTAENGAMRDEISQMRHLLETCLRAMQDTQSAVAPPPKNRSTTPPITIPAIRIMSARQIMTAAAHKAGDLAGTDRIGRESARATRSRSPSARSISASHRNSTQQALPQQPQISPREPAVSPYVRNASQPTVATVMARRAAVPKTATVRRPALSTYNANVPRTKLDHARPSNRLPGSTSQMIRTGQAGRLHLVPFAGIM